MRDHSILHQLESEGRPAPRTRLRSESDAAAELPGTSSERATSRRYQLFGELARGGMGIVLKARDNDLGREVAIKVLHDRHLRDPQLVQRFVEEAQIGGQLQHPGVVPVYELGLRADERPFFAMKLIKGETLAARLAARQRPDEGRREILRIFRDVCQALRYAHARGVIHRDLKPSNVMIGGFGEVQVVDWGFAKVLARGGIADERLSRKEALDLSIVKTVRSEDGSNPSVLGSVMGTPAYMPPEQAIGRIDDLDARSDVFSLGAILCEILTGRPPYTGKPAEVLHAAATAQLEAAQVALDRCGADAPLIDLCKRCLRPLVKDRPTSAEVVATAIDAWLSAAEGAAHQAELDGIAAKAAAEHSRRSRRQVRIVAISIVLLVSAATAALLGVDAERSARERDRQDAIALAIDEALDRRSAGSWEASLAALERAVALGALDQRVETLRREVEERAFAERAERKDRAFLVTLEDIRSRAGVSRSRGDAPDPWAEAGLRGNDATEAAFLAAFEERSGSLQVAVESLSSSSVRKEVAAILLFWAEIRKGSIPQRDWQSLDALVDRLDPEHAELRRALRSEDANVLRAIMASEGDELPPFLANALGAALAKIDGHRSEAVAWLESVVRRHPRDFWLHTTLADDALAAKEFERAARHFQAALSLRPRHAYTWARYSLCFFDTIDPARKDRASARRLLEHAGSLSADQPIALTLIGLLFSNMGENDEGASWIRRALELDPKLQRGYNMLGRCLVHADRLEEALPALEKAIEIDPEDDSSAGLLGSALSLLGRYEEGLSWIRRAQELRADDPLYLAYEAVCLQRAGRLEEAAPIARRVVEIGWNSGPALSLVGRVLEAVGSTEIAVRALQRGCELWPQMGKTWQNLGLTLFRLGRYDEAQAALRKALELLPDKWVLRADFAMCLSNLGRNEEGLAEAQRVIENAPEHSSAWLAAARAYARTERPAEAERAFRKCLELSNDFHANEQFAHFLMRQGRPKDALPYLRGAYELQPGHVRAGANYAVQLTDPQDPQPAIEILEDVLDHDPDNEFALRNLGALLQYLGRREEARSLLTRAAELGLEQPLEGHWDARRTHFEQLYHLGSALSAAKEDELALRVRLRAAEHGHDDPLLLTDLAGALSNAGQFEPALRLLQQAIWIDPAREVAHRYQGITLNKAGRFPEAAAALRRSFELGPPNGKAYVHCALWLLNSGAAEEARAAWEEGVRQDPSAANEFGMGERLENLRVALADEPLAIPPPLRAQLAKDLLRANHYRSSLDQYELLFEEVPSVLDQVRNGLRYDAACAAARYGAETHRRALDFLRADLELVRKLAQEDAAIARSTLRHWLADPDLAGVRDPEDLTTATREFWNEVRALLREL